VSSRFEGKVAVVTGAASGIGAASARQLAAEGAQVVVVDVDEARGRVVADDVGGAFERVDVSDPDAWGALVERVEQEMGGIDLAHLNAGVLASPTAEPFLETPIARHRLIIGVNLGGVAFGIHTLAPAMLRRGGGAIVATASIAGLIPYGEDPTYAATKHGVVGLVRSVAPQLRRAGVRVHAICPGGVDTPLVDERRKQQIVGEGRPMLAPEQVAAAAADLLARDDAGVVQTIDHEHGVATVELPRP
jgi:NAD(P)-dependent dehydrogenase (short-subunit alcohol dehydrogenase family)